MLFAFSLSSVFKTTAVAHATYIKRWCAFDQDMKILKTTLIVVLLLTVILWGLRFISPNLRIEGYTGLIWEWIFPNHDTVFSEHYTHEGFLRIEEGMTEDQVLEILGEPINRWTPKEDYLGLTYSQSPGSTHYRLRQIYLTEGRVKEIYGYYYTD